MTSALLWLIAIVAMLTVAALLADHLAERFPDND